MAKPFYISQLPEKTQAWIKEKTKENFLKDGMSEEDAEQKATDFLDEKVNVAEDFFGKDFYKSLDAIKDNFTPPGAKSKHEKVMENAEEVGIVDEMPEGWKEKEGVLTTPNGYKAISNGGSRFPKEGQKKHELKFIKDAVDTNDNGEIEEDEMADFQKSLDDYAKKNPKGRDDIPVTTRR